MRAENGDPGGGAAGALRLVQEGLALIGIFLQGGLAPIGMYSKEVLALIDEKRNKMYSTRMYTDDLEASISGPERAVRFLQRASRACDLGVERAAPDIFEHIHVRLPGQADL